MTTITAPVVRLWLDEGRETCVCPCIAHSANLFGVEVEGDHPNGPYHGERITVSRERVYDSAFNRPGR
jgi:hypothetical protein